MQNNSKYIVFFASLILSAGLLEILYNYFIIGFFAVSVIALFLIGFPTINWFRKINKPTLFGLQLAAVCVFISHTWLSI